MYFHSACVKNVFVVTLQRSGAEDEASRWEQHFSPFESLLPSTTWGHKPLRPTFFQRTKEKYVISSAAKSGQRHNAVIISKYIDAMDAEGVMGGVSRGVVSVGGTCPAPAHPRPRLAPGNLRPLSQEKKEEAEEVCVLHETHTASLGRKAK